MTIRKHAHGEVLSTTADERTDETIQHTASHQSPSWTQADVEQVLDEHTPDTNED